MSKNKRVFKNADVGIGPDNIEVYPDRSPDLHLDFSPKVWDVKVVLTRKPAKVAPEFLPGYFQYVLSGEDPIDHPTLIWLEKLPAGSNDSSQGKYVRYLPSGLTSSN
jgi:hypothetical protein